MSLFSGQKANIKPEALQNVLKLKANNEGVSLPDVNGILDAQFVRVDGHLAILVPGQDQIILVKDYFATEFPPNLNLAAGASLPGWVVERLAGPRTPGQYAQTDGSAKSPIGFVETAEGKVIAKQVDGTVVELTNGSPVYAGDVIETDENAAVGIVFADETTLALDADAVMTLDDMVYDPEGQDGNAAFYLVKGAFTLVSGNIAKTNPDALVVNTPVATIGIRGTAAAVSVNSDSGDTDTILLAEQGAGGGNDLLTGEITIGIQGATVVINQPFQASLAIAGSSQPTPTRTVGLDELGSRFGGALSNLPNAENSLPAGFRQAVEKVVIREQAKEKALEAEKLAEEAKDKSDQAEKAAEEKIAEAEAAEQEALAAEQAAAEAEAEAAELQAQAEAAETPEEAEALQAEAETARAEAEQLQAQAEAAKGEADQKTQEAAQAVEEFKQAEAEVKSAEQQASEAQAEVATATAEAQSSISSFATSTGMTSLTAPNPGGDGGTTGDSQGDTGDGETGEQNANPDGAGEPPPPPPPDPEPQPEPEPEPEPEPQPEPEPEPEPQPEPQPDPEPDPPAPPPPNKPPVISSPISLSLSEDGSLTIYESDIVQYHLSDPDGDAVQVLNLTASSGSLVNNNDGSWAYTPAANVNGSVTLGVTFSDGKATVTGSGTLSISAVNDAPVLTAIDKSALGTAAQTFTLSEVLGYASDVDGDTLTLQTIAGQSVTAGTAWGSAYNLGYGTLGFDGAIFTFTPTSAFSGSKSFEYTVSDGTENASSTVTLNALGDIRVNTTYTNLPLSDLQAPDVTALSDGGWLVTWTNNGRDGSTYGAFAQRYNSDGSKYGEEFQVSTQTINYQWETTALQLDNGEIIIAFGVGNGSSSGAFAQRYDSHMAPIGDEFKLNETNINYQGEPQLVDLGGGKFGVTYRLEGSGVANTNYSDIFYREFDASNVGSSQVVVNTNNFTQHQNEPAVAISGTKVLVTWSETSGVITNGIYGRVYNTDTTSWETDFAISTNGSERVSKIVTLSDGRFIVTWHRLGVDGNGNSVQAQFLNADGTLSGSVIDVNTTTTGNQEYSDVVALSGGGFLVVWHGPGDNSADTADFGIWAQRFDSAGAKVGSEIQVNASVVGNQKFPDVTVLSDGDFIVTWQDDGDDTNVVMQRFNSDGTIDATAIPTHIAPVVTSSTSAATFAVEQSFTSGEIYHYLDTGDFNNDGHLDIALASGDGAGQDITIRLNDGLGNFGAEYSVVTAAYGRVTVGDLNNDGFDDIVSNTGHVYLNDQDNTFTQGFSIGTTNRETGLADVDGDGDLDMMVLNQSVAPKIYLNDGAGGFSLGQTFTMQQATFADTAVHFGDFDADGDQDVIIGGWGLDAEVWENDGTGSFTFSGYLNNGYDNGGGTDSGTGSTLDIETGDLDGDGDLDVYLNNRYGQSYVFKNNGDGSLSFTRDAGYGGTDVGPLAGTNGRENSSIGDLDGDGDLDIVASHWDGADEYLINDGTGTFTNINATNTITTYTNDTYHSAIGDFNGDGHADVFKASYTANHSEVIFNNSNEMEYCYHTDVAINPFANMAISDGDSTQLAYANIIVEGFKAGDVLAVGTPGSLSVSYNSSTGVMNISGLDTIANYQTAIQSISFTSATDAAESRVVTLTVGDEYGTESSPIGTTINLVNTDPLVVDLDGDGVELVGVDAGVQFDMYGDEAKEATGWVGADDGILVVDTNENDVIDNIDEFISPEFQWGGVSGQEGDSSLDVLSRFDQNDDGAIDNKDEIYEFLKIWNDANTNGITDSGELKTLKELGIDAIDLNGLAQNTVVGGNTISQTGTAKKSKGEEAEWAEVAFAMPEQTSYQTQNAEAPALQVEPAE